MIDPKINCATSKKQNYFNTYDTFFRFWTNFWIRELGTEIVAGCDTFSRQQGGGSAGHREPRSEPQDRSVRTLRLWLW